MRGVKRLTASQPRSAGLDPQERQPPPRTSARLPTQLACAATSPCASPTSRCALPSASSSTKPTCGRVCGERASPEGSGIRFSPWLQASEARAQEGERGGWCLHRVQEPTDTDIAVAGVQLPHHHPQQLSQIRGRLHHQLQMRSAFEACATDNSPSAKPQCFCSFVYWSTLHIMCKSCFCFESLSHLACDIHCYFRQSIKESLGISTTREDRPLHPSVEHRGPVYMTRRLQRMPHKRIRGARRRSWSDIVTIDAQI